MSYWLYTTHANGCGLPIKDILIKMPWGHACYWTFICYALGVLFVVLLPGSPMVILKVVVLSFLDWATIFSRVQLIRRLSLVMVYSILDRDLPSYLPPTALRRIFCIFIVLLRLGMV